MANMTIGENLNLPFLIDLNLASDLLIFDKNCINCCQSAGLGYDAYQTRE